MSPKKILSVVFLIFLVISPTLVFQSFSTSNNTVINNVKPITVKGFHYVGTLPNSSNVTFTVFIPLKNENLIYYYAYQVSNPSSPLYHHFLTKKEVQELFYPIKSFNRTLNYLKNKGFKIILTASDSVIVAQGTVAQVENYLGLYYEKYSNGSVVYYTAYGKPKIDAYIFSSNYTAIYLQHPNFLLTQKTLTQMEKYSRNLTEPFVGYSPKVMQRVYNTTWLYNKGYEGTNYTIGILDFYGDPEIVQQLHYFDKIYNLPNVNLTIVPIGRYEPNLGILTGWAYEISLDVEISHVMAPKSNIVLYVGNNALDLPAVIAYIDQQDKVDVLSQSFGFEESALIQSPQLLYDIVMLTNMYYALGSAEGITFLASSGDGGGSGYSFGPLGDIAYPSESPFVTAVGGTTTYVDFPNGSYQTAWSSYGFIPFLENEGGSTGGVSIIEPTPWYQWGLSVKGYPNGRMTPDVSANANIYPGIYIIAPGNSSMLIGGTSEASPLTAGLLTVEMQYIHHKIGLFNPLLYYVAKNDYGKAIEPVTFGYNIPWVAKYGYNLVTGWGTINAGELATYLSQIKITPSISIEVNVTNSSGLTPREFYPGQVMYVWANITNGSTITSGNFYVSLETIQGNVTSQKMFYNSTAKLWEAKVIVPQNSNGITFVNVYGDHAIGFTVTFTGFIVEFQQCFLFGPSNGKVPYTAYVYNIYGITMNVTKELNVSVYSYNITTNLYTKVGTYTFNQSSGYIYKIIEINGTFTVIRIPTVYYSGNVSLPEGVYAIEPDQFYGFTFGINGDISQGNWIILSHIVSMPGVVSPGQTIYIDGVPNNFGANITAKLVNPQGIAVSQVSIPPTVIFIDGLGSLTWEGFLKVPSNASPGLYSVLLFSTVPTHNGSRIDGYFYGQLYVSPAVSEVHANVSKYVFEGSQVKIYANITYSNGTEVKYGIFSSIVYPKIYESEATTIELDDEFNVPLYYNSTLNLWVGEFNVPSSQNLGNLTYYGTQYYGGPLEILIFGNAYNGYPTNVTYKDQYTIYALPYTEISNSFLTNVQPFNVYLNNDTLMINKLTIDNAILNNDTIYGDLTITYSNLTNIKIVDSNVTLISSNVRNITVIHGHVNLINSKVQNMILNTSSVDNQDSVISGIYPSLPNITIISPSPLSNITGKFTLTFEIKGSEIKDVQIYINNVSLSILEKIYPYLNVSLNNSDNVSKITLNSTALPDGTYEIKVVAQQADGLTTSKSIVVNFANKLNQEQNQITSLNQSINNIISKANNEINSLKSQMNSLETRNTILTILAIILAIIAIAVAIIVRKR